MLDLGAVRKLAEQLLLLSLLLLFISHFLV